MRRAAGGEVFPQSDTMFYLFLFCLMLPVYTIPDMNAAEAQGWGAFFGTSTRSGPRLCSASFV